MKTAGRLLCALAGYDFTRAIEHATQGHAWRALLLAAVGTYIIYSTRER